MVDYLQYISIDSQIRFGKPCIKGTRIAVTDILGWMASDMSLDDILYQHPSLSKTHILTALAFSAEKGNVVKFLNHPSAK